jgi:hypothetical protein
MWPPLANADRHDSPHSYPEVKPRIAVMVKKTARRGNTGAHINPHKSRPASASASRRALAVRLNRRYAEPAEKPRSSQAAAEDRSVTVFAGCGRCGRSHPAASQELGIENSDHPQSRHT